MVISKSGDVSQSNLIYVAVLHASCPSTNCWYFKVLQGRKCPRGYAGLSSQLEGLGMKTCRLHLPSLDNHYMQTLVFIAVIFQRSNENTYILKQPQFTEHIKTFRKGCTGIADSALGASALRDYVSHHATALYPPLTLLLKIS